MEKGFLPVAGLCLLAIGLAAAWPDRESPAPDASPADPVPASSAMKDQTASAKLPPELRQQLAESRLKTELPPLPPELEGLEPDIRLFTDEEGNLVPNHDLRVLLDFYLANLDQEPLTTVLARIRNALGQQLGEPALGQALSLLERYVGYRLALEELENHTPNGITLTGFDLQALQQRQARMEQLQHDHFNRNEQAAFFQADTELDNHTLARLAIEQNPALSADQKHRQLEQLSQQLPENVRLARKRAVIHGEVYQKAEALKASQASDTELYQLRARELGEDAALELAKLDRQQQAWQQRLADYRQQKSRILQASLSDADQADAITQLRQQLFSGPERLRVRALEGDWQ